MFISLGQYNLRHTTASLYLMAGLTPVAVQRIMRHRDPRLTTERYGHLVEGFMQAEVDRLVLGIAPPPPKPEVKNTAMAVNAPPFVPLVSPTAKGTPEKTNPSARIIANTGVFSERRKGFEPSTPSLGSSCSTN